MATALIMCERLSKLAGEGMRIAAGTVDLTDASASVVVTGLSAVRFCSGSINVTAGGNILVIKHATAGSISVKAAAGTSGTTTVNWFAIGIA